MGRLKSRSVDGDLLSVAPTLVDGGPLPVWLGLDSATLIFSGFARMCAPGLQWGVRAADPGALSNFDTFAPEALTSKVRLVPCR